MAGRARYAFSAVSVAPSLHPEASVSHSEWVLWMDPTAVDFFNHLNMLYGTVTEFCTPQEVRHRCPISATHGRKAPS